MSKSHGHGGHGISVADPTEELGDLVDKMAKGVSHEAEEKQGAAFLDTLKGKYREWVFEKYQRKIKKGEHDTQEVSLKVGDDECKNINEWTSKVIAAVNKKGNEKLYRKADANLDEVDEGKSADIIEEIVLTAIKGGALLGNDVGKAVVEEYQRKKENNQLPNADARVGELIKLAQEYLSISDKDLGKLYATLKIKSRGEQQEVVNAFAQNLTGGLVNVIQSARLKELIAKTEDGDQRKTAAWLMKQIRKDYNVIPRSQGETFRLLQEGPGSVGQDYAQMAANPGAENALRELGYKKANELVYGAHGGHAHN